MRLVNQPLAFVDIETSGGDPNNSRVIEVAVIRVENSKIMSTYQTLINPRQPIDWQITRVTGLTDDDLFEAPSFKQIAPELLKILDGCIFVAHNVEFDYRFLKSEFKRMDAELEMPHLCTVRLSRVLFPQFRKHSLETIIQRFGIEVPERHRAMADTAAMWEFYKALLYHFDLDVIDGAVDMQLLRQQNSSK